MPAAALLLFLGCVAGAHAWVPQTPGVIDQTSERLFQNLETTPGPRRALAEVDFSDSAHLCAEETIITTPGESFGVGTFSFTGRGYARNMSCTWRIQPKVPAKVITIVFKEFHTEYEKDYLSVYIPGNNLSH